MPVFDSTEGNWPNNDMFVATKASSPIYINNTPHLQTDALIVPQRSWMIAGRPPLRVLAREMLRRLRGR